ncbi:MAG: helix-turn-helix domain-containing protein [Planctomycetes bacterium]|nr:helix-turn-helix domain-containing protein [Planctomycetota bacterium]
MKSTYTSGEAANICGLSLSTVKRWIKRGALQVYHTPGGDIRIPHEQLREFMCKYDIPLHHLEDDEPRVLINVADRKLRRSLLLCIEEEFPHCKVETVEGEMDLGFHLGNFRPWVLILAQQDNNADLLKTCTRVRDLLAPETVRIGVVNATEFEVAGKQAPNAFLEADASKADLDEFIWDLMENIAGRRQHPGRSRKRIA